MRASAGDARLGGDDFVDALAQHVAQSIERDHGFDVRRVPLAWARVIEACESAKKRLTHEERTGIALHRLPCPNGKTLDFELSFERDLAERLWAPLLERLRAPIRRALNDGGMPTSAIDEVLLVGGATRIPCVARAASLLFGKLPLRALPPDEAVALGAAVQAALKAGDAALGDLVATDVAPFTIGISTTTEFGGERITGVFSPIIHRERRHPGEPGEAVLHRGGPSASRGSRSIPRRALDVQREHQARRLPCFGLRAETCGGGVARRSLYLRLGILEVDTTVGSSGKTQSLVIERTPGRLTAKELSAAREAMKRIRATCFPTPSRSPAPKRSTSS